MTQTRAGKLPGNLLDALHAPMADKALCAALGSDDVQVYIKPKTDDWNSYARHQTQWERDQTPDC